MGFIYSSLNRGAGESVALFDNRIARMLPFVTGKAYFDFRNYDAQTGEFGVYIEWDGELEAVLGYSLPAGGYFVKATTPQAYRFNRLDSGIYEVDSAEWQTVSLQDICHDGRQTFQCGIRRWSSDPF